MKTIDVKIPDIGDYKDVPVIEVLVKPGDEVKADEGLVTLESDKATMDVPAPAAGKVKELRVKVGDRVSQGSVVLTLESEEGGKAEAKPEKKPEKADGKQKADGAPSTSARPERSEAESKGRPERSEAKSKGEGEKPAAGRTLEVKVPSIGDYKDVPVIEVLVKAGDEVEKDAGLVTLESDKATMDVPSPSAGKVKDLKVKVGDRVSEGAVILLLEAAAPAEARREPPRPERKEEARRAEEERAAKGEVEAEEEERPRAEEKVREAPPSPGKGEGRPPTAHASPSIRQLARELGVDLSKVTGTGPKGRILKDDVQGFVKEALRAPAGGGPGLGLPAWPKVDFARFGPVESKPLSRIQKIAGPALSRNWVMIPHVTQFDEADVTDLEAFRAKLNEEHARDGVKVTILAFLVKACVAALRQFPVLNSSLDGDHLVLKKYFHIGFAADTPNGLVVPVIRDADQKGVLQIAQELGQLAARAREGKLQATDMQGGSFSISSLGGIGGTSFTPIINAPEVAILGVSRTATRPVWDGEKFAPRLVLPFSLSYDHRVVDGALGARFTSFLAGVLGDMRRAML
jgi:pyruvate dehydrogenase E2 component (dihydrolipoamide acetyltransferase)